MAFEDAGVQARIEGILAAEEAEEEGALEEGSTDVEEPDDGAEQVEAEADDEAETEAATDDEQEEDDAEEAESDGALVEFELDGQTVRLTPDEVKAGYLRESDYTRKLQEVSRGRDALAGERQAFEAQQQQAYQQFAQHIEALKALEEPEPDWKAIRAEDPLGYIDRKAEWDEKQAAKNKVFQEHQQRQMAARQKADHDRRVAMQQQAELLPQLVPEWKDPAVMAQQRAELRQALIEDGFPQQAVDSIGDARLVRWLLDGKRYRDGAKSTAKPEIVKKKVAGKPKVQKPGTTPKGNPEKSAYVAAKKRARETQRPQDWTNVFERFV